MTNTTTPQPINTSPSGNGSNNRRGGLLFAGLAGGALFLTACSGFDVDVSFGEDGNGTIETRTFELPSFDRIEIDAIYDVDVTVEPGATQVVTVETDENLFDSLQVEVVNGELVLDADGPIDPSDDLKAVIIVPSLSQIDADGASSTHITGEGGDLAISTDGVSSLDASGYDAANVNIDADGASSVELSARGSVVGSADGASSVDINEASSVSVSTDGVASVDRP